MHATPPPTPPARHRAAEATQDSDDLRDIVALCQKRGLVLTALRLRVLRILMEARAPLKAYAVLEAIRQHQPGAAPTSTYRALEFLQAQRWAVKLTSINGYMFVPPSAPSRLTYLVCDRCGSVQMVKGAESGSSWIEAARISGFVPASHIVEISGCCVHCR